MDIWSLPGWVALIFVIFDKSLGFIRSRRPLKISVRNAQTVWHEDNCSIAVFQVDILNPSSQPRTITDVQIKTRPLVDYEQYPFDVNQREDYAICHLPNGESSRKITVNELLAPPFDISPHKSISKVFATYFKIPSKSDYDFIPFPFHFFVIGVDDKQMATCTIDISTEQLRTIGVYTRTYSAKLKP